MVKALRRLEDIQAIGIGAVDSGTVPPRRLTGLAAYGLAGKASALRRLEPREQRIAVLAATAKAMLARAVDDVLEVFDLLMTSELLGKAERQSKQEKLRRFPRVSRNAGKLAAAVKVLLEMVEVNQDVGLGVVWDMIEKSVTRSELRYAVESIDELVPAGDAELDGQRIAELTGKLNTVRPFLPLMMERVAFGATPDGAAVLAAMKTLGELLTARPTAKLPSDLLDARKVDHDLIAGAWSRLVYRPGRPEGTVKGRVHDVRAGAVPPSSQAPQHLRRRLAAVARPASAPAGGREVGLGARVWHERAESACGPERVPRGAGRRGRRRLPRVAEVRVEVVQESLVGTGGPVVAGPKCPAIVRAGAHPDRSLDRFPPPAHLDAMQLSVVGCDLGGDRLGQRDVRPVVAEPVLAVQPVRCRGGCRGRSRHPWIDEQ
jgi:hypothetical protein